MINLHEIVKYTALSFRETSWQYVLRRTCSLLVQLVHQLFLGKKAAGDYRTQENAAHWDRYNQDGESVASGVYFYRLHTENFTATRKMCILK